MRRPGLFLPLLAALACGPTARHSALETLPPASTEEPMVACVDAVLANSPLVERVTTSRRSDHPRSRGIVLRNPPSPRSTSLAFVINPSRGAPRELVVEYAWPGLWQGNNGMQPPPDQRTSDIEGQMLADIGAGLLRDVRTQCAPNAPGEAVCSRVAAGRTGRCVLGT
jgi:hypothetical protein